MLSAAFTDLPPASHHATAASPGQLPERLDDLWPVGDAISGHAISGQWIARLATDANQFASIDQIQRTALQQVAEVAQRDPGPSPVPFSITRQLGRNMYLVATGSDATQAHIHATLGALPELVYVEPNRVISAADILPTDPQFDRQWGLHNVGQTSGRPDTDIDAPAAWELAGSSSDLVVAVVDSGVDYLHPDLVDRMWQNSREIAGNGIDDDSNGYVDDRWGIDTVTHDADPMDAYGHGTHVAGIIGATRDNGIGIVGVAPDVRIMAIQVLNSFGLGSVASAVEALHYMIRMRRDYGENIVVSNNSWGGSLTSQAMYDALTEAIDVGILQVAAAGNLSSDIDAQPFYPASLPHNGLLAVAYTDHVDRLAIHSNYGAQSVDLTAPGVNIYSTEPGGQYGYRSGTSMATPHVTGTAALLKSKFPLATPAQLVRAITAGVDPIAAATHKTVTGGRLNAMGALQSMELVVDHITPVPGEVIDSLVRDFTVRFSEPVHSHSIQPYDLLVNDQPADRVTIVDHQKATFHFDASPIVAEGKQTVILAAGGIAAADDDAELAEPFTSTFRYDANPLQVVHSTPADQSVVELPLARVTVEWNEPIDPQSLSAADLRVKHGYVTSATLINSTTAEFLLDDVRLEDQLSWQIPAGSLSDIHGNPSTAFSGVATLDYGTVSMPASWQVGEATPTLEQRAYWSGALSANDRDTFIIALDANQTVSIKVTTDASLAVDATWQSSGGVSTLPHSLESPGILLLEAMTGTVSSDYELSLVSTDGTQGAYQIEVLVGAAWEWEHVAWTENNSAATAQPIDEVMTEIGQAVFGITLMGTVEGEGEEDWYRMSLDAMDSLAMYLQHPSTAALQLELFDSHGHRITSATTDEPGDAQSAITISGYRAPVDETVLLRITGTNGPSAYRLFLLRNAAWESRDTTAPQWQRLTPGVSLVGSLNAETTGALGQPPIADPDAMDAYRVSLQAGDRVTIATFTPAGEPLYPNAPFNALDPSLNVYRPDGFQLGTNHHGASDGKNAVLEFTAALRGDYLILVSAEAGRGNYLLTVDGATIGSSPLQVATYDPAKGAMAKGGEQTSVTITFDDWLDERTIDTTVVHINGVPVTSVVQAAGRTLRLELPTTLGDGVHELSIPATSIRSISGMTNSVWQSTLIVDSAAPRIVDVQRTQTQRGTVWDVELSFVLDEPLRSTALFAESIRIKGRLRGPVSADAVTYHEATHTLRVHASGLREDEYTLRLISGDGALEDHVGNDLDGEVGPQPSNLPSGDGVEGGDFVWTWSVDAPEWLWGDLPRTEPLGSGVAGRQQEDGALHEADDVDQFSWNAAVGEVTTIVITPSNTQSQLSARINDQLFGTSQPGEPLYVRHVAPESGDVHMALLSSLATRYHVAMYQQLETVHLEQPAPTPLMIQPLGEAMDHFVAAGYLDPGEAAMEHTHFVIDFSEHVGRTFDLAVARHHGAADADLTIEVFGPGGQQLAHSHDIPDSTASVYAAEVRSVTITEPGSYQVRLTSSAVASFVVWGVVGGHIERRGTTTGMRLNDARRIGAFVDQPDWYHVDLVDGQRLQLRVTAGTIGRGGPDVSPLQPEILLFDNRQQVLVQGHTAAPGTAVLDFHAVRDGRYRVQVRSAGGAGEYQLATDLSVVVGDFNNDAYRDCADLSLLEAARQASSPDPQWDLNADESVSADDILFWIYELKKTRAGDANLDYVIDGSDWNRWFVHRFSRSSGWCDGDFNADGWIDASDHNAWFMHRFTTVEGG